MTIIVYDTAEHRVLIMKKVVARDICKAVRELRASGLNRVEIAKKCHVSPCTLRAVTEGKEETLTLDRLYCIAIRLRVMK